MKKMNQLVWFDPITMANLNTLFVKSGAHNTMAMNEFISKMVQFVVQNKDVTASFIKQLYILTPELKDFSMFVEKVEVEKPVVRKVFICPICLEEFEDVKRLKEHLEQVEKVKLVKINEPEKSKI
jgi:hypothetical protein